MIAESNTVIMALWPSEKVVTDATIEGAWTTAPLVWDAMTKRYLGLISFDALLARDHGMMALWKLTQNPRLPDAHRAVLAMTGDGFMLQRFAFGKHARRIEEFVKTLAPEIGDRKNGLIEIGTYLLTKAHSPCVGFWWTTAAPNPWLTMNWKKAWTLYKRKPNGGGK